MEHQLFAFNVRDVINEADFHLAWDGEKGFLGWLILGFEDRLPAATECLAAIPTKPDRAA